MHFSIPNSFVWGLVLFIKLASPQSYSNSSHSASPSATTADDCRALQDAWNAASSSFDASVYSGRKAGAYSTSITTAEYSFTETEYSYDLSNLYTETWGRSTVTAQYAASTVATIISVVIHTYTNTIVGPSYDVPFPTCSIPYTKPSFSLDCTPCTLVAPNVQLIYFPVSTVSGNPNLTITPTGTSVPTGVFNGIPYTSGQVYFKYDNISAINGCLSAVGSFYPGAIVTLRSDEVSSLRNDGTYFDGAYSFNYADLNYPVPYSAWIGQFGCANESPGCLPVETGPYNPYVSIPSEVKNLDPAWASCTMDPVLGSWDPPYALTPVQGILTQPGPITVPTAIPADTPTSQATPTPIVLSTQSAGPMEPSSSETVDPPSLPETTTTSGVYTTLANPQVSQKDPNTPSGVNPGDLTLQPSLSTKTATTILGPTATAIALPGQTTSAQLSSVDATALGFVIASQSLTPGGQIVASGTTYSLLPIPTAIVIDGSTRNLPPPLRHATVPPIITIGSTLITQDDASDFIIGSQTLTPGGAITVSGITFSLPVSRAAVVIDGSTFDLSHASDPITLPPVITVGASIITENAASDFVIGSQTLTPGGQITVSGEVISLDASAAGIAFGSTSTQGLGALIMSGFGPFDGPTATGTTTAIKLFTGETASRGLGWWTDMVKAKVMLHVALILVAMIGL